MINYFKHTDGEAFTLNNEDYVGFFNIVDNIAYTGKSYTAESILLTPKSTFIADTYIKALEFDTTYNNIPTLTPYYSNTFDLLDAKGMSQYIDSINNNNLICFNSLVLGNPTVFNYEETNGRYYGLESTLEDSPDSVPVKYDYNGNIEPFSVSQYWAFLDEIITGVLLVDVQETFKYICSNGVNDYILTGSFSENVPLTLSYLKVNANFDTSSPDHATPNFTYSIHHDKEASKLLIVKLDAIEVYDITNFENCENLILIDRLGFSNPSTFKFNVWSDTDDNYNTIPSTWNDGYRSYGDNFQYYVKFGKNIRSIIENDTLILSNKYSIDEYRSIKLTDYGISNVIAIDIRTIDDYVVILHKDDEQLKVSFFDPSIEILEFITRDIYSINYVENMKIQFSDIDSNIFYINSSTEYQSRYISAPKYPSGRLELEDLHYPEDLIWNTAFEIYNLVSLKWDNINKSNTFNNLTTAETFTNNKMYMILHNVGRLYALQQYPNDRFLNAVPLNLSKSFKSISCNQSSIGLYLNSELSNLIYDTMNISNSSSNSFTITENSVNLSELTLSDYNYNNSYFNGNETVNVITLQRISTNLINLQNKLLPS